MVSGFLGGSWPEDAAPELQSERRGTISASRGPLPEEGKIDYRRRGGGLSQMGETLVHTEDTGKRSK